MTDINKEADKFVKQIENEYKKGKHQEIEIYITIDKDKTCVTKKIIKKDDKKMTF